MLLLPKPRNTESVTNTGYHNSSVNLETTDAKHLYISSTQGPKEQT